MEPVIDDSTRANRYASVRELFDAVVCRLGTGRFRRLAVSSLPPPVGRAELDLSAAELDDAERAIAPLREPLEAILAEWDEHRSLSDAALRDFTILTRRLEWILQHVRSGSPDDRFSADELDVDYECCDLARLLRQVTRTFEPIAAHRHLSFEYDLPEAVTAELDVDKIELGILNLVFNAFRFTAPSGHVRCTLDLDEEHDEAVIVVEDTGVAIENEEHDVIFDRSRSMDRNVFVSVNGLGLSLGTAKDVVALHGGSIASICKRGPGASFEMRLPRHAPKGLSVRAAEPTRKSRAPEVARIVLAELERERELDDRPVVRDGRPLILLIEDSRAIQRLLVDAFEPEIATASAFSGTSGLALALELSPDLVLVDLMLPGLDGHGVIEAIRRRPEMDGVPIVVLSGACESHDAVELFEHGVQDVVRKPFLLPELKVRVRNQIAAKRTRDMLRETVGQHETDIVKLAAEVKKRQMDLEAAVAAVEDARRMAEAANQIKSNFLRMMSHELKTPITAMQLHMRVLERDPDVALSPRITEGFERISRSSRRLLHLVDTVLEWARVESGRLRLSVEDLDLRTLLEDVTKELSAYATQKRIQIVSPPSPEPVECHLVNDRRLVRLLLVSLVGRAIQVTNDGVVKIALAVAPTSPCAATPDRSAVRTRGWRVTVTDGAPPIPAEQRAELFDPLQFAHDLHRKSGSGSGLGLHVVRDIARAIDGDLSLDGPEDEENRLVLTLRSLDPERTTGRFSVGPGFLAPV